MKNKAFNDGGGIYIAQNKSVTFDYDCCVSYNTAGRNGGGIFLSCVDIDSGTAAVKLGDVENLPENSDKRMKVNYNEAYNGAAVFCGLRLYRIRVPHP